MRAKIIRHAVFILLGTLFILFLSQKSLYILLRNGIYLPKFEYNESIISVTETRQSKIPTSTSSTMAVKNDTTESILSDGDRWIKIDDDTYIFSAYWESRVNPYAVRIVGIGLSQWTRELTHVTCSLRYSARTTTTKVRVKKIPEGHGMKHTAILYLCATDEAPLQATLFVESHKKLEWLDVRRIEPTDASERNLAVCVQPLYGKFANNNLHLAEFISFYQLLNASRFTFYNYKADYTVVSLLSELSRGGAPIELLKWDVPDRAKDAWTYAQLASIVDCAYRHTQSHEYVFFVDVDEFLVPRENITLQELIERIDKASKWCTYMFRQSFFCLQLPDDPGANYADVDLFTLKKVLRSEKVWNAYMRTKSIVRTFSVDVPGIHYVWSTISHKNEVTVVNPEVALLHHYRGGISDDECKDNVMDKSAVKYSPLIMNSGPIEVWRRWNASSDHLN